MIVHSPTHRSPTHRFSKKRWKCAPLAIVLLVWGTAHSGEAPRPRTPWSTSRVVGTPDPPAPYKLERAFPQLEFAQPVHMAVGPSGRMFVVERSGHVVSFLDDQAATETATFIEPGLGKEVYSIRFHPRFEDNRFVFVFTSVPNPAGAERWPRRANRIVRLTVDTNDPPRVLPDSQRTIIQYVSDGHNGGDLHFGPEDGYLYISSGDGSSDSDTGNTGQDISDLPSGMIRIAVADSGDEGGYTIPDDNPFLELEGARRELWAYGFRNPWRFCFDPETGDLYVGDVGQDLWEMIWLVQRGGNYGWSVQEGSHDFHPLRKRGPTPILPPLIEHHHTESRSITGGVVYHGDRLPELEGAYLYGDYETGKIWGLRHVGGKRTWSRELADTSYRPASFELGPDGRFYVVGHLTGQILELVPAESAEQTEPFPRLLSETGLFHSVTDQAPADGVVPYSVNAPQWSDGVRAERWLAVPGDAGLALTNSAQVKRGTNPWPYPEGTVLVKTLSNRSGTTTKSELRQPERRFETQLLTLQNGQWAGYSYRWNQEQTDAELVPREGAPGGDGEPEGWRFVSRSECMVCHSRAAAFVLGATTVQLNHGLADGRNQLEAFVQDGVLDPLPAAPAEWKSLPSPYDDQAPIEERARAYLHANCAVCHVAAGGGNAKITLSWHAPLDGMALLGSTPLHGDLGIPGAMLVSPGDPERSIVYQRLSRRGAGQMPPLGTARVDERAAAMIERWIRGLKPSDAVRESLDRNVAEAQGASGVLSRWYVATTHSPAEEEGIRSLDGEGFRWYLIAAKGTPPRVGPYYPVDVPLESTWWARTLVHPSEPISIELRAESSAPITLWLGADELEPVTRATASSGATIATWEASLPAESIRFLVRLSSPHGFPSFTLGFRRRSADPKHEALTRAALSRRGDPETGRRVFQDAQKAQCSKCHRVGAEGAALAPDLTGAGSRFSRASLIESILEPSRVIAPRYTLHSVILDDGRVLSGIKVEETDDTLVIGDQDGKQLTLSKSKILQSRVERLSLMPAGMEKTVTEDEFVGLIEFLMTSAAAGAKSP